MVDEKTPPPSPGEEDQSPRFPELEEIQREVEKRIRDNKRFLEGFLDEDFTEEEEEEGAEGDDFEEL